MKSQSSLDWLDVQVNTCNGGNLYFRKIQTIVTVGTVSDVVVIERLVIKVSFTFTHITLCNLLKQEELHRSRMAGIFEFFDRIFVV